MRSRSFKFQGHRFRYQLKAHMRLPISDLKTHTYILSLIVSKLLQIIGYICAVDSGGSLPPSLTHSFEALNSGLQNLASEN